MKELGGKSMNSLNLKDDYEPKHKYSEEQESNEDQENKSNKGSFILIFVLAFILGIATNKYDVTIPFSRFNQDILAGLANATFVLLIAGVTAAIASRFTEKWMTVFYVISALLLIPRFLVFYFKLG